IFSTHQMHIRSRGTKTAVPLDKVPPLYIDVNGHTITFPSQVSWRRRSGMDWFVVDVPVRHLKKGINNIIFRSDKGSTWRIGLENSLVPNRSAQSTDGGKTWNYDALGIRGDHNGEFLIRLRLKRYAPAGSITSPVIDLAEETSSEKIKKQIIVKKPLLQWEADTPKGTDVVIRTRSGLTRLYNPATWTEWSQPNKSGQQFKSPKLRYVQWKATLVTRVPKQTPALKSVKISGSVITRPSPDEKRIKITEYQNETIVQSSWPFTYQRWDEPKLKVLREQYNLDEIIKGAKTEFEKYLRLRHWCRWGGQWRSHWCGADPGEDALNILEWCVKDRAHCGLKAHSFCHHYAHVYAQCCLAMGLQARMLVATGEGKGHCYTEVWSNDYKKWVFMDATHDFHVAEDGKRRKKAAEGVMPISALERHNRKQAFPLFRNIAIWFRNDILSYMPPNPIWDGGHHFRWDGRLWWLDRKYRFQPEFTKHTDRVADLYWTLNQTAIDLQYSDKPGSLLVNLETVTPNFDTFEIKLDDKPWRASPPAFTWKLRKGRNEIQARTRNKFGNPGIVSRVALIYP
ncbi:MAG: transglutaminase domain-containing protein, partial [Phycisphaerae bacterium]|nr:transglutaminase domain-containing protein [Phycisphaerae bacterium]